MSSEPQPEPGFSRALYYIAGVGHVLVLFLLSSLLFEPMTTVTTAGDVPTNLFGPSNFHSKTGQWLIPDDFHPETKPYDSFRGHYVRFPLGDSRVDFGAPEAFNFGTEDFTLLFWFKGGFDKNAPGVVRKHSGHGLEVRDWADGPQFHLGLNASFPSGAQVSVRALRGGSDETQCVHCASRREIRQELGWDEHRWYSYAVSRKGTKLLLYLDTVLVDQADIPPGESLDNDGGLILGNQPGGLDNEIHHVKIDDLSLWRRALSAEDLLSLAHSPMAGDEEGLVAYWNFDEGGGEIVHDRTPNGHHGKVLGNRYGIGAGYDEVGPRGMGALFLWGALLLGMLVPTVSYFRGQSWAKTALLVLYALGLIVCFGKGSHELLLWLVAAPMGGVFLCLLLGKGPEAGLVQPLAEGASMPEPADGKDEDQPNNLEA